MEKIKIIAMDLDGTLLDSEKRLSEENRAALQKAADMGCVAIIARSAPTDHACAITEQAGITLIGFARDDRFNIYTCPQRVTV